MLSEIPIFKTLMGRNFLIEIQNKILYKLYYFFPIIDKYLVSLKKLDINKNKDLLNNFFIYKRFTKNQRFEASNIAKVSKDIDELQDNLAWDYKYKNIK